MEEFSIAGRSENERANMTDTPEPLWGSAQLYDYFAAHGIEYERLDHPAVFTADEAALLVPQARGAHAKNLFVEDRRSGQLFMVTVPFGVRVDLARTAAMLEAKKLQFASADLMLATLGVTPGAVSMLALVNDRAHRVSLVIEASLWEAEAIQCHPLENTATLVIARENIARFLDSIGHTPSLLALPFR
jgi:Ala-tRNA(Pro) deacylase